MFFSSLCFSPSIHHLAPHPHPQEQDQDTSVEKEEEKLTSGLVHGPPTIGAHESPLVIVMLSQLGAEVMIAVVVDVVVGTVMTVVGVWIGQGKMQFVG